MQQRWADRTDLTHALFRNTLCFTVQESGQLMGEEGKHFHQHLLLTVEYLCFLKAQQTQHSPFQLSSPDKEEVVLKFRQAPGSRLRLLNTEESRGPRTSQKTCSKISTGKALSSLETNFCLISVIVFGVILSTEVTTYTGQETSEVTNCSRHCYPPELFWIFSLKPSWSINSEEPLNSQVLVMKFRLDSSLSQQRLPVHS